MKTEKIEALKKYINGLLSDSFEGWTEDEIGGYKTALISVQKKIEQLENQKKGIKIMREIKFRVWEYAPKEDKYKMHYNDKVHVYDGEILAEWSQVRLNRALNLGGDASYQQKKKSIFMQYIGLMDKYGKEIYEGDIVKCKAFSVKVIVLVKDIRKIPIQIKGWDSLYDDKNYYREIIGNIYENPELLKNVSQKDG